MELLEAPPKQIDATRCDAVVGQLHPLYKLVDKLVDIPVDLHIQS